MKLRRLEQAGAVFTEDCSDLESCKRRGFTIVGQTKIVNTPFGKGISCDGSLDYIQVPASNIKGITNKFSCSVWAKANPWTANDCITGQTSGAGLSDGWSFMLTSTNIKFWVNHYQNYIASVAVSDLTIWHHYIGIYDGANVSIYVDGVLTTGSALTGNMTTTSDLQIGAAGPGGGVQDYTGQISQVAIFNRVLTQQEVTALYQNKPFDYERNIVSRWTATAINPSETVKAQVPDIGYRNNQNNLLMTGGMLSTAIANGRNGKKAFNFDGSNDQLYCSANSSLTNLTNSISIA